MYSKDTSNEHIVIPLSEVVVYPETRTKFLVGKTVGEALIAATKSGSSASAVGLTAKSDAEAVENPVDAFYTVGTLLSIMRMQPADEGYSLCACNLACAGGGTLGDRRGVSRFLRTSPGHRRPR